MNENRRKAERHPVGLRIQFDSGTGLSRDVSGLGVYFHTDARFERGDEIEFTLIIPDAVNVNCRGRVLRIETGDGRYGVAASIDSYALDQSGAPPDAEAHLIIRELQRYHD